MDSKREQRGSVRPGARGQTMARFRDPELIPYVAVLLLTLLVVTSYNTSLRSDTRSVTGGASSDTVGVVRGSRPNVGGAGGGAVHGPDESHVAAAKMGYVHNPRHKAETFNKIREPTTHQKLHNKIVHNRDHKDAHSHASQTNLESITDGLASLFHSTREEDHEMLNKIMTHQKELKVRGVREQQRAAAGAGAQRRRLHDVVGSLPIPSAEKYLVFAHRLLCD